MSECESRIYQAPVQDDFRNGRRACFGFIQSGTHGFTLIELLVVIAIIAILAAILFPVFASAKESGKRAKCIVQLKQLTAAVISYTDDNSGRYVPAAADMYNPNISGGQWRWHGYRPASRTVFDFHLSPLYNYMARSGGLKQCPSASNLVGLNSFASAFESGCGGFGYNEYYVGGTYYRNSPPDADTEASCTGDIAHPASTVMFADTAMARYNSGTQARLMIEYSFAEPPYRPSTGSTLTRTSSPSINFRHGGRTNVAWCDGHVTSEKMTFTNPGQNTYRCDNAAFGLGWFGPDDNSLFDNK